MNLKINGEEIIIKKDNLTIYDILSICKVEMPEMVSVQLNGAFVERLVFASTVVSDGDEIDFLYFMGGGAE